MRFNRLWLLGGVILVWIVVENSQTPGSDADSVPAYQPASTYSVPAAPIPSYNVEYGIPAPSYYGGVGTSPYGADSYAPSLLDEDEEPEPVDVSYEMDALRRAARDLEWSASRLSDGSSNWRGVVPEVENDLYRTERRLRDLESVLSTAEVPLGTQFEVDRIRSDVRNMRGDVDAMRMGVDWSGTAPTVQDAASTISRRTRNLETSVILEPPIRP